MADAILRLTARVPDGRLVALARNDAMDAKRELFVRHVGVASAVALRLMGADADIEDIVQDSFVSAFERLDTLQQPDAFRGWLLSIVTRTAIGTLRRRKIQSRLGLRATESIDVDRLVAGTAPPDVMVELRLVYGVAERLPASERVVLILRRLQQLTLDEIAEQTGYSLATVKRRLARAEEAFERALQRGRR